MSLLSSDVADVGSRGDAKRVPQIVGFPVDSNVVHRDAKQASANKNRSLTDFWRSDDHASDIEHCSDFDYKSEGQNSFRFYDEEDIKSEKGLMNSARSERSKCSDKQPKVRNLMWQNADGTWRRNTLQGDLAMEAQQLDVCDSVDHANLPALFCQWCGRRLASNRHSMDQNSEVDLHSARGSADDLRIRDGSDDDFRIRDRLLSDELAREQCDDVHAQQHVMQATELERRQVSYGSITFSDQDMTHEIPCSASSSSGVPEYLNEDHVYPVAPCKRTGLTRIAAVVFNGFMAYWTISVLRLAASSSENGPAARRMLLVSLPFWIACTGSVLSSH